jgi:hypothetical protein
MLTHLDYIFVKRRVGKSIRNVQKLRGAGVYCYSNVLGATICT